MTEQFAHVNYDLIPEAQTVAAYAEIEALKVENDDNHFTDAERAGSRKGVPRHP